MNVEIQVFGLLFGSPLLTLIVMPIAGFIFAVMTKQLMQMLTAGVSLRRAMSTSFAFVICGFATIYCFLEAGLAIFELLHK
jgi:hypothetical protein